MDFQQGEISTNKPEGTEVLPFDRPTGSQELECPPLSFGGHCRNRFATSVLFGRKDLSAKGPLKVEEKFSPHLIEGDGQR